jgi:adenosylmethionine-8-amino-7-oxononanoate aminotransferase
VRERIATLARRQENNIAALGNDGRFSNVRRLGTITALDVEVRDAGYLAEIGPRLYADFLAKGVLLRPLGSTIYVMPPYCITADELATVYQAIGEVAAMVEPT